MDKRVKYKGIVLSHPTGNAFLRVLAKSLKDSGLLHTFFTTVACFSGTVLYNLSRWGPVSEIRRRSFDESLRFYTRTWPWLEIGRMLSGKIRWSKLTEHEKGLLCVDAIYRNLDERVARSLMKLDDGCVEGVYAYEDGAYATFLQAKKLNLCCLYDLPIGYWRSARRLLQDEYTKNPDWSATLPGLQDSESKLEKKDDELRLANHIFVASSFTKETLLDYPDRLSPVSVIPYGFPPVSESKTYLPHKGRALRLLFIGGLSQRKGISYLFEAVDNLGSKVELTVVGRKVVQNCFALNAALAKHTWIPSLSHNDILQLMRTHDILVFPSLFEGFGLVITEAMSQGTPVITTNRTAGVDLITHGKNGWIVDAGSAIALEKQIEEILIQPNLIQLNGKAARETARNRPWSVYGKEMSLKIHAVLKAQKNV